MDRDTVWLGCSVTEPVTTRQGEPCYWVAYLPRDRARREGLSWMLRVEHGSNVQPWKLSWAGVQAAAELVRSAAADAAVCIACDRFPLSREEQARGMDYPHSTAVAIFARPELASVMSDLRLQGRHQLGALIDNLYGPPPVRAGQGGSDGQPK